jgi:hypothetical protein
MYCGSPESWTTKEEPQIGSNVDVLVEAFCDMFCRPSAIFELVTYTVQEQWQICISLLGGVADHDAIGEFAYIQNCMNFLHTF